MLNFVKKITLLSLLMFSGFVQSKTIIWDLDGVLFRINKNNIIYDLGLTNLFKYVFFDWKSPYFEPVLFKVLEAFGGKQKGPELSYIRGHSNEPLPAIMLEWQLGKITGYQILEGLLDFINAPEQKHLFVSEYEKNLIEQAVKITFDPYNLHQYTEILSPGLRLLEECYYKKDQNGRQAHQLIVLSNRDYDSFALLKNSFPQVFNYFLGSNIIISAHIGLTKPDPAIFNFVLDKFKLNPQDCIFLDDQLANVNAARSLGIHSIQVKNGKFRKVRRELKKLGII